MRIVCLAWGSLVWKAGALPVRGAWRLGGPSLPIEFARVGDGGELATALVESAAPVPVRWAELATDRLDDAREALRQREEVPPSRTSGIGSLVRGAPHASPVARRIAEWISHQPGRAIDAVVWTALPPRSDGVEGRMPTAREAVDYLSGLRGEVRDHAEAYVRRVAPEIRTPHRFAIERALGWLPAEA